MVPSQNPPAGVFLARGWVGHHTPLLTRRVWVGHHTPLPLVAVCCKPETALLMLHLHLEDLRSQNSSLMQAVIDTKTPDGDWETSAKFLFNRLLLKGVTAEKRVPV